MHSFKKIAAIFLCLVCYAGAQAQERASREEAKAMVDAAVEHVEKAGPRTAFKDFSNKANKSWHIKDLFVSVYTMQGVNVAHGANDRMVGKNFIDSKDHEGKALFKELRDTAAKGGGWVDFKISNPETKKVEDKSVYVTKLVNFEGFATAEVTK